MIFNNNVTRISASQLIPENILLYDTKFPPHLYQVEIDPIDLCNHNCIWCFTADFRRNKKISIYDLKKYLLDFCKFGGKSVVFSGGGEPLLYEELYEPNRVFDSKSISRFLIENQIAIGLITNGYYLDNLFFKDFSITDFAFIRVSLDATNGLSHSMFHNTNREDFPKIINNIKMLIKHRQNSFTPAIGISFVVDSFRNINYNKNQIKEINKLACELNVDFVQFKHVHTSEKELANEKMRIVHSHCTEMNWNDTEFWVQMYNSPKRTSQCLITQYIQSIGNQSMRFPCCHLFGRSEFLRQDLFFPKGKIMDSCDSNVCRYSEMNDILSGLEHNVEYYRERLESSIMKYGFHPYRYCPTAPSIFKPFKKND